MSIQIVVLDDVEKQGTREGLLWHDTQQEINRQLDLHRPINGVKFLFATRFYDEDKKTYVADRIRKFGRTGFDITAIYPED